MKTYYIYFIAAGDVKSAYKRSLQVKLDQVVSRAEEVHTLLDSASVLGYTYISCLVKRRKRATLYKTFVSEVHRHQT